MFDELNEPLDFIKYIIRIISKDSYRDDQNVWHRDYYRKILKMSIQYDVYVVFKLQMTCDDMSSSIYSIIL